MLATMIIETVLLIYTVVHYRLTPITRIVVLALFFLALFQLAEYNVCGSLHLTAATWSRIGYVAITMLPPLGIHLILVIANRGWKWLALTAYATGIAWAAVFGLSQRAFTGYVCHGNYVIFQLSKVASRAYSTYYYFWLGFGILLAAYFAIRAAARVREALILQIVGYVIFLLPTMVIANLRQTTRAGIPSIMCGFAVIYAFILVFGIVPLMTKKQPSLSVKVDKPKP